MPRLTWVKIAYYKVDMLFEKTEMCKKTIKVPSSKMQCPYFDVL